MKEPVFNYDEASDTLHVTFEAGEKATGIELNDHILLRINKRERKAVGLSFFDYSVLAQRTDMGHRSFPLPGLMELPPELQEIVLDILQQPPVSDVLTLSAYTPSYCVEPTPITALRPLPATVG